MNKQEVSELFEERPFQSLSEEDIEKFIVGHRSRSEERRLAGTRYLSVNPKDMSEDQSFGYLIRDRVGDSSVVTAGFWNEDDIACNIPKLNTHMYERLSSESKWMLKGIISMVQKNVNRISYKLRQIDKE